MTKTLGISIVGILLLASPVFATTDPIAELRVRIYELQQQIAALMAQNPGTATTTSCSSFTYDLYIGKSDATTNGEVSKLQRFLIQEGVYPEAKVTGYYGNLTAQAVTRWQKAHGMDFVTLTSGVGSMTRSKIIEGCGDTSGATNNGSSLMTTYSEVREACFEGCHKMRFEFSYPKASFIVTKNTDPETLGLLIKEVATGKTHQVRFAYEGGRGYTYEEWWKYNLNSLCPNCNLVANPVTVQGADGMRTYSSTEKMVIVFGRLGFNFAFILQKPDQNTEKILSSIILKQL